MAEPRLIPRHHHQRNQPILSHNTAELSSTGLVRAPHAQFLEHKSRTHSVHTVARFTTAAHRKQLQLIRRGIPAPGIGRTNRSLTFTERVQPDSRLARKTLPAVLHRP